MFYSLPDIPIMPIKQRTQTSASCLPKLFYNQRDSYTKTHKTRLAEMFSLNLQMNIDSRLFSL